MKMLIPTEPELHAYVDGELDETRRRQIESLIASQPELARQAEQIRQESQRLRASMEPPPADTPVRLDPFRIRRELRDRMRHRVAVAASLVLALTVGGMGGWQTREIAFQQNYLPMADAMSAYRLFAVSDTPQMVDVKTSDPRQLQTWLDQHFVQPAPLPDFSSYGFRPVSGRLMSSEQGTAAMILYQNQKMESIVYYVRPPGNLLHFSNGARKEGNLLAQYWRNGRYFYAVVSATDTPTTLPVQRALEPGRI
ncbi:Transmembrane activator of PrtI [Cupriavidus necator]|uniref:Anti-sigma factor n=1 Tax=Cupriavidus necator (strain ATCC 17699 / DSM 428 / KCTC 22496 / NCIMB 10442 / H16 / Stanier 337) TaxID=381666 RepID=Q0K0G3_CUPNH|nr:anti-sigma factor [Cupriavidus necator]QCC04343.1 anti-sigma factor [Cupriavidus necator H16]QQB79032.1 anti-sigma factor [Cupriavidus necator]WKA43253.1 anti-sigma factor [Cupriavidus necator]CAJ96511.1 transmembrane activator of PrtI [Cupriavidus necator H16]